MQSLPTARLCAKLHFFDVEVPSGPAGSLIQRANLALQAKTIGVAADCLAFSLSQLNHRKK